MLPELNVFHAQFLYFIINGAIMIIIAPTMYAIGTPRRFTDCISLTIALKEKVVLSSFSRQEK